MRLLLALALAAASSRAFAGEIHVPADYPDLETATREASPGDVILVDTAATQDPCVVSKPLTILGNPVLKVRAKCAFDPSCTTCPHAQDAFHLKGNGSGRVVIGNAVSVHADCYWPASAIGGGGFDELHVYNCTFDAVIHLTGSGHGFSTIKVDVPHVLIDGSKIKGGKADSDDCYGDGHLPDDDAYAAIEAPASAVTVLGSEIAGGGPATFYCCAYGCACPPSLPMGGKGGNGIVASAVYVDAASGVTGGQGSTFKAKAFSSDPGVPCGTKPDGAAFVASAVHALPGTIDGSGATALGGTFTLAFDVPGPLAVLFFSGGLAAPLLLPGAGYSYLAAPLFVGPVGTGAPQILSFPVPPVAALLGLEGGFQIFDLTLGLTAPAVGVLGP